MGLTATSSRDSKTCVLFNYSRRCKLFCKKYLLTATGSTLELPLLHVIASWRWMQLKQPAVWSCMSNHWERGVRVSCPGLVHPTSGGLLPRSSLRRPRPWKSSHSLCDKRKYTLRLVLFSPSLCSLVWFEWAALRTFDFFHSLCPQISPDDHPVIQREV